MNIKKYIFTLHDLLIFLWNKLDDGSKISFSVTEVYNIKFYLQRKDYPSYLGIGLRMSRWLVCILGFPVTKRYFTLRSCIIISGLQGRGSHTYDDDNVLTMYI